MAWVLVKEKIHSLAAPLCRDAALSLPRPSERDKSHSSRRILFADAFNLPTHVKIFNTDNFLGAPYIPQLLDDDRSQASVQEVATYKESGNDSPYLVTAGFRYGQYFTTLISRVHIQRGEIGTDPTVVLRNGYVHMKCPY
jgi:hypothetical protein